MNRRRPAAWLVALLFVSVAPATGCLTVGRNFVSEPVSGIAKGVTTKADVSQLFGEPFRKGIDDGYESWTYLYNRLSLFSEARSKDLYVVFNKDATVRSYTFNSNVD